MGPEGRRAIALPAASRLVCHGCGFVAPLDAGRPFRCPNGRSGDSADHVLRRSFDPRRLGPGFDARRVFLDPEPNPFRRYRSLLHSYSVAHHGGMTDSAYLRIVDRLDAAVAAVDGAGFRATPLAPLRRLADAIGLKGGELWVKDETENVSGSHKARHLMGIMIWLEVARRLGLEPPASDPLVIASCGNAALAAAVVACAAGRRLEAFVPEDARPRVLERLALLGAELTTCVREAGDPPGDPTFHRFEAATSGGATPFGCQAKVNGLTVEGGCTLAWEMVSTLLERGSAVDHVVIQVGGGALAGACVDGLRDAVALGLIDRLPRIHTVQTRSAYPLRRAYLRISDRLLDRDSAEGTIDLAVDASRALEVRDGVAADELESGLAHARGHGSDYMWPWETTPRSIAVGILDDETYDWVAVCEGMLSTAGIPIVVGEELLEEAHTLGREWTDIVVEPTGTAGLAGLLALHRAGVVQPGESVALLFTGAER